MDPKITSNSPASLSSQNQPPPPGSDPFELWLRLADLLLGKTPTPVREITRASDGLEVISKKNLSTPQRDSCPKNYRRN